MERHRFEPISTPRTRSPLRGRSRSNSRSIRSRLSRPTSLSRVYSAQAFDDHVVYSPPQSPTASRPNSTATEAEFPHGDASSVASSSHDDVEKSNQDRDLEKQETEELAQPELEWRAGVVDERDFKDVQLEKSESRKSQAKDPNLVEWDGPNDPLNPKNWSMKRKWAATFIISAFTFISPVSSSMVAPALSAVDKDLGIHSDVGSALVLSIFVLAYAIGPLFLGPMSEVYGRIRVIQLSNLFFLAWNIGCGFSQTSGQMRAFRFLSGLGGSAPLAIGGGVLSDCWSPDQRGKAVSIYTMMP